MYIATEATNKFLLITSITSVTDLICSHGEGIFENVDGTVTDLSTKQSMVNGTMSTTVNTTTNTTHQTTFRRLYKTGDGLMSTDIVESYTISNVYEQLLKVLDDEVSFYTYLIIE